LVTNAGGFHNAAPSSTVLSSTTKLRNGAPPATPGMYKSCCPAFAGRTAGAMVKAPAIEDKASRRVWLLGTTFSEQTCRTRNESGILIRRYNIANIKYVLQFVINATQYLLYTIMINLPVVVSKYPSNIHKRAYARAKEEVLDTNSRYCGYFDMC
jgi:hypothetical protein